MSKLYIMVGIPGSGKSYYLKKITNDNNTLVVSRDEVRFSLISNGDEYFSKEKQVFKEFVHQIQKGLNAGKDVYADATHLNGVSRLKLMNALSLDDIEIIPIVMKTPLEICLERNSHREGRAKVPESVIKNMYFSMVDPANDEKHMDYKYSYIVYNDFYGDKK